MLKRLGLVAFSSTIAWSYSGPVLADGAGLVLVLNSSSGSFETQKQNKSFARHFGAGGVPLLADEPDRKDDDVTLSTSDAPAPARVVPAEEVLAAIDEVGLRYAGHMGLRQADMTVTEWLTFFRSNIEIESAYKQTARSSVGAIGLGQLMPGTAAMLGVDPYDTKQNLDGSARYLLMLLERFGDMELALAGYNAGPEAVQKYGGIPPYAETQGHVKKVMAVYRRISAAETTE